MTAERQHPVRRVLVAQGRRQTWLAERLGISANYLHRVLLPPDDPDVRPVPEWFYPRVALLLGVPEDMLHPEWQESEAPAA